MSTVHFEANLPTAYLQVYLCGDSAEAKQAVKELATRLGLSVLDRGCLSAAREVEDFPLQLFPQWRLPLCLATGLTAFFFFYLLIRDVIYAYVEQDKDISFRIMVSLANKVGTSDRLPAGVEGGSVGANVLLLLRSLCYDSITCLCVPAGVPHRVSDHVVSVLPAWRPGCLPPAVQRNQVQVREH